MDSPLAAPIGRVARHFGLLGITLAVVSALLADAAYAVIDNPPTPDSPEGVAALLRWCWTHRDAQRYRDIFTADYQFIPGAPDIPWNRDDELRAATALFGPGTGTQSGASSITLDYLGNPPAGTLYLPGEPYPQYQQLLTQIYLHVYRSSGTTLDAGGMTLFHLVRGDIAAIPADMQARGFGPDPHRWYVQRWEDTPAEGVIVDHPPALTIPATLTVGAFQPLVMDVTVSDADGDPISSLTAAVPPGASFTHSPDNTTGQLTWTPTRADTGAYAVTFTASNRLSVSATTMLTVRVNRPPWPQLVLSPTSGIAPLLVRLDASGSVDPDGTLRSFRFDFGDGSPGGTQAYPITTHMYPRGQWTATVTVTDSDGAVDSAKATVNVSGHNVAPLARLTYSPSAGKIPLLVTFNAVNSRDSDGHIVRYDLNFGDGVTQTLTNLAVTHTYTAIGRYTAVLTVTDDEGLTGTTEAVVIAFTDRPPVVTAPPTREIYARHPVFLQAAVVDPDQDPITSLIARNLPQGATFSVGTNNALGTVNWTPAGGDTGVYNVTFVASNALTDSATTQIIVRPDRPPWIVTSTSISGRVGRPLSFMLSAGDYDGDPITSLTASPLGSSVLQSRNSANTLAEFLWTPADGDLGDHTVVFTAANALSATAQTVIHVGVRNQPPTATLSGSPLSGLEPLTVDFTATGSDSDGRVDLYRFDFADGSVVTQVSPIARHTFNPGTWNVRVFAIDNLGDEGSATVTVNVTPATSQPNLARNPSFESDTRFWGPYAGSVLQRVADAHEGSTGLQITGPPVINGSFGVNDSPDMVRWTLSPGLKYRYTAWVRSLSSHGRAVLRVTEYLIAGGVKLGMVTSPGVTLSPTWQKLTVDYTTTAANSTLDFQVRDFPLEPSEVFITDDIAVRNITGLGAGSGMAIGMEDVDGAGGVAFAPRLTPIPIRDGGTLRFVTSQSGPLRVELLDLAGRRVRRVMDDSDAPADVYALPIGRVGEDGIRLSAGVYFWRVAARDGVKSGRFVILP